MLGGQALADLASSRLLTEDDKVSGRIVANGAGGWVKLDIWLIADVAGGCWIGLGGED